LNYLSVCYSAIYHATAEQLTNNSMLSGVEVSLSQLSPTRHSLPVIWHRTSAVDERKTGDDYGGDEALNPGLPLYRRESCDSNYCGTIPPEFSSA
jgi:hypothetical protein